MEWRSIVGAAAAGVVAGCYVGVDEIQGDGDAAAETGDPEDSDPPGPEPEGPGAPAGEHSTSPGLRMLSAVEYRFVVADLFDVEVELDDVPQPERFEGHASIASVQGVGADEVDAFIDVGAAVAQAYVERHASCFDADEDCAVADIERLTGSALRLAEPAGEAEAFVDILFDVEAGATLSSRAQTSITALLSSPSFLYRRELGTQAVDGHAGRYWLDGEEIASRMSLFLWQSVPDAALLHAAAGGELLDPQGRAAQLNRMLEDPRALRGAVAFAEDWLDLGNASVRSKDASVLDGLPGDIDRAVGRSFRETVAATLTDPDASLPRLLDTSALWVDDDLAALLGVEAAEGEGGVQAVEGRTSILTHPRVIAAHTKEQGLSPFTVGAFLSSNILCEPIPPPLELPSFEPDAAGADATLREQLEALTAEPACQSCHARIGPPGFAFLPFDPVGRMSTSDGAGRPFDTVGQVSVGDDMLAFDDASDLSARLAETEQVRDCLSRRFFRWTYGRFEAPVDTDSLELQFETVDDDVKAFLRAVVIDDAFAQTFRGDER